MKAWSDRPSVVAAMLNPALVTTILATAANQYHKATGRTLPWELSFIVAPLVLHRGTRQSLPHSVSTHLASWVSRSPQIRAGFPARAQGLVEPVKEGLRFGLAHGGLSIEDGGLLGRTRRPKAFQVPSELEEVLRKSGFVGRWLAKTDSTATTFAILGVAP